jgi:hypothetical protein
MKGKEMKWNERKWNEMKWMKGNEMKWNEIRSWSKYLPRKDAQFQVEIGDV